jgi:hypothetical protein
VTTLSKASLDEFAFRLLNWNSEGWLVLVVHGGQTANDVAMRIVELLRALGTPDPPKLLTVTSADSLIHYVRKAQLDRRAPLVSCGYERFRAQQWKHLDLARSVLATNRPIAMVMGTEAFVTMQAEAPNLASWVGASAWEGVGALSLSDQERETRLTRLRQRYKMSDVEAIALARSDASSVDPDFVEWLILLRQDGVLGAN